MFDRKGQRLGDYLLTRKLGQGTYGIVYLGQNIHDQTQAAIKVLEIPSSEAKLKTFFRNFTKEARLYHRLQHPHIIKLLDFDIEEDTPFLVMDYAPNGTLRDRHKKGLVVPLDDVVTYVSQVADALQYAHENRVIHRDVKPENMFLGANNNILLGDFGVSVAAYSTSSLKHKDFGMAGTPNYMAPEQFNGRPRFASDQYALGIVVYEWLSGKLPFTGEQPEHIRFQHLKTTPPSLNTMNPSISIPSEVEHVVMKALEKDPQNRYENVQLFAKALAEASHRANQNPVIEVLPDDDDFELLFDADDIPPPRSRLREDPIPSGNRLRDNPVPPPRSRFGRTVPPRNRVRRPTSRAKRPLENDDIEDEFVLPFEDDDVLPPRRYQPRENRIPSRPTRLPSRPEEPFSSIRRRGNPQSVRPASPVRPRPVNARGIKEPGNISRFMDMVVDRFTPAYLFDFLFFPMALGFLQQSWWLFGGSLLGILLLVLLDMACKEDSEKLSLSINALLGESWFLVGWMVGPLFHTNAWVSLISSFITCYMGIYGHLYNVDGYKRSNDYYVIFINIIDVFCASIVLGIWQHSWIVFGVSIAVSILLAVWSRKTTEIVLLLGCLWGAIAWLSLFLLWSPMDITAPAPIVIALVFSAIGIYEHATIYYDVY
jgi:serine/threonine protein kinase